MMEAMLPLVNNGEDQIGWMKAENWREMRRILVDQKIIAATLPDLKRAFFMHFFKNSYRGKTE